MTSKTAALASKIEADIAAGILAPGEPVPSEQTLTMHTGYSRGTVRAALADLEARGLIEGSQGTVRRVVTRTLLDVHVTRPASRVAPGQDPTSGADSWQHDVTALGHTPSTELRVRMTGDAGRPVISRELLRFVDGRPHNLATWEFPALLAAGTALELPGSIDGGAIPYLASIGAEPDSYVVTVEARMPARDEAARLQIPGGVPVLVEDRRGWSASTAWTADIFRELTIWPGDRARLILDL